MPDSRVEYPRTQKIQYEIYKHTILVVTRIAVKRLIIEGADKVPTEGAVLLCFNHLSFVDAVMLGMFTPRYVQGFAADKYRTHFWAFLLKAAGTIWVNREEMDKDALQQALAVLKNGNCLAIAPEGTRSKTASLGPPKMGAAYLATRADVPIVPIAFWGTEAIFGNLGKLRRTEEVGMRFGDVLRFAPGRARSEELQAHTEEIMLAIARLLPEPYHGVYAGHPKL